MSKPKNVEFSITTATSGLERVVTDLAGDGLGTVHQFITQEAYGSDPTIAQRMSALGKRNCTASEMVSGVIWNDFPLDSVDPERTELYARFALRPFDAKYASYMTNPLFRVQPVEGLRVAMAAVHKSIPDLFSLLFGVNAQYLVIARRMIRERINEDRPHRHFMRKTADEPDESVIAGAVYICLKWMAMALQYETAFYLGNLLHTLQDSFSAAHTRRTGPSESAPFGAVQEIFFFGNQNDHSHSRTESWREVMRSGSEASRRVVWLMAPMRAVISFFLTSMETLKASESSFRTQDDRRAAVDNLMPEFAQMLIERVFLHTGMAPRLQSSQLSKSMLLPRSDSPVSAAQPLKPAEFRAAEVDEAARRGVDDSPLLSALPAKSAAAGGDESNDDDDSSAAEDSDTEDATDDSDNTDGSQEASASGSDLSDMSDSERSPASAAAPSVEPVDGEAKSKKNKKSDKKPVDDIGRGRGRGWGWGRGRGWGRGPRRGGGGGLAAGLALGLGAGALAGAAFAPYGLYDPYYDPYYVRPRRVIVRRPPPHQVTYVSPGPYYGSTTTTTTYLNAQIGAEQQRVEASMAAKRRRGAAKAAKRRARMEKTYRPEEGDIIAVRVLRVHDGDTVRVQPLIGRRHRGMMVLPLSIRLMRIDAPELNQPGGKEARRALKTFLGARHKAQPVVYLRAEGRDRYFRTLGTLFAGETDVNAEMVRLGYAHYYPYDKQSFSPELEAYEQNARRHRLALWSDGVEPELPSRFRKRIKAERKAANKKRGYALWYEDDSPLPQPKASRLSRSEGSQYPGRA